MGKIVFWVIIRLALTIIGVWALYYFLDYEYWWAFGIIAIYAVVINPAIIQYRIFEEQTKDIVEGTLCSSCKYFDKSAVLCTKLDEHPTKDYLPCSVAAEK